EREAPGLSARRAFLVLPLVRSLFVVLLAACGLRSLSLGGLDCPEEERRQPRVLLNGARGTVAGLRVGSAQNFRQRAAAYRLPDFRQILVELDLAALGILDFRVPAEDL